MDTNDVKENNHNYEDNDNTINILHDNNIDILNTVVDTTTGVDNTHTDEAIEVNRKGITADAIVNIETNDYNNEVIIDDNDYGHDKVRDVKDDEDDKTMSKTYNPIFAPRISHVSSDYAYSPTISHTSKDVDRKNGAKLDAIDLCYSVIINGKLKKILKNVSFSLEPGCMCALMGSSTAGKR